MLHCYNCGANMPDNMLYCTSCGRKLDTTEQQTQVLGGPAASTTPFTTNPETRRVVAPTVVQPKKGGALKAVVITLVSLGVIGVVVVVAGVMFVKYVKQRSVSVNANIANRSVDVGNIASVNVTAITDNTNAMIDNAMKQIQKAANDALAAANKASNVQVSTGKTLDGKTTRINFRPGAVSATAVGTVAEEATFVLRAKAGQTLTARLTSPNDCIKFEDGDSTTLSSETDSGDNYITVTNACGKPTSMVLSVSIK